MPEPDLPRPDLLDLQPRIAARKIRDCNHRHVVVDMEDPVLECTACGAEVDPFQHLRMEARLEEDLRVQAEAAFQRYAQWTHTANERLARLSKDIADLTATKNRLWNEQIGGRPVGAQVRARRKKTV